MTNKNAGKGPKWTRERYLRSGDGHGNGRGGISEPDGWAESKDKMQLQKLALFVKMRHENGQWKSANKDVKRFLPSGISEG